MLCLANRPVNSSSSSSANSSSRPVQLNVGGQVFTTTVGTLHSDAASGSIFARLASLLDGQNILQQQSTAAATVAGSNRPCEGPLQPSISFISRDTQLLGDVFIDRDSSVFSFVLNYLRDRSGMVLPSDKHTAQLLLQEAKFYQLTGLTELLNQSATSAAAAYQPSEQQQQQQQQQQQSTAAPSRGRPGAAASTHASLASDAAVASSTAAPLLPIPLHSGSTGAAAAAASAASVAAGSDDASGLAGVIAASRVIEEPLRSKAQELAGMLLKVRIAEEEEGVVFSELLRAAPSPAVALVALFKEALDTSGVEHRLRGLLPFLDAQIAGTNSSNSNSGSSNSQGDLPSPHITQDDISTALLAMVAVLDELFEELPKSPVLVAEVVGHYMAAGQLTFGLQEFAAAVRDVGAAQQAEKYWNVRDDEGQWDPLLVEEEKAAPMLLIVANAIKAKSGEDAAKAALTAAGIDLTTFMPSSVNAVTGISNILRQHNATYLAG